MHEKEGQLLGFIHALETSVGGAEEGFNQASLVTCKSACSIGSATNAIGLHIQQVEDGILNRWGRLVDIQSEGAAQNTSSVLLKKRPASSPKPGRLVGGMSPRKESCWN